MEEIKINVEALDNKIKKLRELRNTCNNLSVKEKNVEGSGDSIAIVNKIDMEYVTIKNTFLQLLNNSINFFENVKSSVIQVDKEAAKKIN